MGLLPLNRPRVCQRPRLVIAAGRVHEFNRSELQFRQYPDRAAPAFRPGRRGRRSGLAETLRFGWGDRPGGHRLFRPSIATIRRPSATMVVSSESAWLPCMARLIRSFFRCGTDLVVRSSVSTPVVPSRAGAPSRHRRGVRRRRPYGGGGRSVRSRCRSGRPGMGRERAGPAPVE